MEFEFSLLSNGIQSKSVKCNLLMHTLSPYLMYNFLQLVVHIHKGMRFFFYFFFMRLQIEICCAKNMRFGPAIENQLQKTTVQKVVATTNTTTIMNGNRFYHMHTRFFE